MASLTCKTIPPENNKHQNDESLSSYGVLSQYASLGDIDYSNLKLENVARIIQTRAKNEFLSILR